MAEPRSDTAPESERVAELGAVLATHVPDLTGRLFTGYAAEIHELQGDPALLDLLRGSVEGNLETVAQLLRGHVDLDAITAPASAREYARRLAQRGVPLNALVRAYRLGQQWVTEWAFTEIRSREQDPEIAYAAMRRLVAVTFRYIDRISEQVVAEYEAERQKWLSHQNTVRTQVLEQLLAGEPVDLAAAEATLGHRLRQRHLAAVLWSVDRDPTTDVLHELERLSSRLGREVGAVGSPLFEPRDRSTAWVWFPLGHLGQDGSARDPDAAPDASLLDDAGPDLRAAFGSPGTGPDGFRTSHAEALRAEYVAAIAQHGGRRLTSYAAPGMRTASLLAADLEGTRRLVADALGPLAGPTRADGWLRETLLVFLDENASYVAAAARLHLHKNTVRYRVEKALGIRGRPLDDGRFELRLALLACHWLGDAVLAGE